MTWTLVGHNAVGFTDGNSGHVYTLPAGTPSADDLDILCINSDTVVSMPSGFSGATNFVNSQGSYMYYRFASGSEGSTVTITTSGNFSTDLVWLRWQGGSAFDTATNAHVDGSGGLTTPAVTTSTLADSNDLVVAFAALHTPGSGAPTNPVWSSGYTAADQTSQGAVAALVGYKTGAGTAAESPSVSWTNDYFDRYILVAAFTPAASGVPTIPGTLSVTSASPRLALASTSGRLDLSTSGGDA